jgi:hypothetical protein
MQNKPNFQDDKMIQVQWTQGIMKKLAASGHKKTNPIQSQFNPKQTQSKPKQSQLVAAACLVEASTKTEALSEAGLKPTNGLNIFLCKMPNRLIGHYSILMEILKKVDN